MTQEIGWSLIVSAATAERISAAILVRKICESQLKGIQQPVELFEAITVESQILLPDYLAEYKRAQTAYDVGNFQQAIQLLTELKSNRSVEDPVVDFLLGRAKAHAHEPAQAPAQEATLPTSESSSV